MSAAVEWRTLAKALSRIISETPDFDGLVRTVDNDRLMAVRVNHRSGKKAYGIVANLDRFWNDTSDEVQRALAALRALIREATPRPYHLAFRPGRTRTRLSHPSRHRLPRPSDPLYRWMEGTFLYESG